MARDLVVEPCCPSGIYGQPATACASPAAHRTYQFRRPSRGRRAGNVVDHPHDLRLRFRRELNVAEARNAAAPNAAGVVGGECVGQMVGDDPVAESRLNAPSDCMIGPERRGSGCSVRCRMRIAASFRWEVRLVGVVTKRNKPRIGCVSFVPLVSACTCSVRASAVFNCRDDAAQKRLHKPLPLAFRRLFQYGSRRDTPPQ